MSAAPLLVAVEVEEERSRLQPAPLQPGVERGDRLDRPDEQLSPLMALAILVESKTLTSRTLQRQLVGPRVSYKALKQDGLVGALYSPRGGRSRRTVLALGGSEGGLPAARAALLASHQQGHPLGPRSGFGLKDGESAVPALSVPSGGGAEDALSLESSVGRPRVKAVLYPCASCCASGR